MTKNKKIGDGKIIIYNSKDGEAKLEVRLENETVWLSLNQIAELFDTDKSGISRHIQNIYNSQELDKKPTVA
ncbi:MAG: virulence factor, partial [Patescibacteria group bacterium]|nr:virulence factor [Patescibacteria group bacterium]